MANTAQARKRARQAETTRQRNASLKSALRTAVKKVKKAIATGDKAAASTTLRESQAVIDRIADKRIVHKNLASRTKSRLAQAIRQMHSDPARSWTVSQLAKKAAMSRSAFFERFTRAVGLPPMEYLLAWRMALAKNLLRRQDLALVEVAERVGYGSASAFSTAFSRHVGQPPSRYARASQPLA